MKLAIFTAGLFLVDEIKASCETIYDSMAEVEGFDGFFEQVTVNETCYGNGNCTNLGACDCGFPWYGTSCGFFAPSANTSISTIVYNSSTAYRWDADFQVDWSWNSYYRILLGRTSDHFSSSAWYNSKRYTEGYIFQNLALDTAEVMIHVGTQYERPAVGVKITVRYQHLATADPQDLMKFVYRLATSAPDHFKADGKKEDYTLTITDSTVNTDWAGLEYSAGETLKFSMLAALSAVFLINFH